MLADRVGPFRSLVLLAGAALILSVATSSIRCTSERWTTGSCFGPTYTTIHVKLRVPSTSALAAQLDETITPLFTTPAADERAHWFQIHTLDAKRALHVMARDSNVEEAFMAPEVSLPHEVTSVDLVLDEESCPITTPSFESYQGYLGPAPHGIDAPAAWRRGARGQGVWFADVEGGWNAQHEDLPGDRITHAGGRAMPDWAWRAHGTAVLGEVVGRDNGKGVVGIAPDVERVFTSSIGGTSVANAIDVAARAMRPGDVLLIELQVTGPRTGKWIPVEYHNDVFAAIKAATDRGVVVIEAAGNGGEDLDHKAYQGRFDRTKRDSGAIMVGAGGPPHPGFADRERLDFSNYGARVDVQGWGRKVATLDYGDLQACDDDSADRHYTALFSGTSSASPIVAGAAVILQGVARAKGAVIPARKLRDILRETGTPQAGDTSEHIGPRPDLARALRALD